MPFPGIHVPHLAPGCPLASRVINGWQEACRLWRLLHPCSKFVYLPQGLLGFTQPPVEGTGEEAHCSYLLTALVDLPPLPPNNNGKMCFLEIILKTERKGERTVASSLGG